MATADVGQVRSNRATATSNRVAAGAAAFAHKDLLAKPRVAPRLRFVLVAYRPDIRHQLPSLGVCQDIRRHLSVGNTFADDLKQSRIVGSMMQAGHCQGRAKPALAIWPVTK